MKNIVQISDLHFGTEDLNTADGLIKDIESFNPALVIVSGDLTQRGRVKQYIAAKEYLKKIKFPKLVIPGNHDIPLFDIFRRFFFPLTRFKKYINEDLSPIFIDEEIAVFGINTARSLTWKEGRISMDQIKEIEKELCSISNKKTKIVVTHHPFIPPPGDPGIALVGRSVKALDVIDRCSVDLLLSGHLHQGYSGDIRRHYQTRKRSVISVQAGTAISNRRREEPNAYNLISVENNKIFIQIRIWNGEMFSPGTEVDYIKENKEWKKVSKE